MMAKEKGMPRYSIIIPVYNVEPYLRECLDSVLAQDSQSEYEVILVDDGSTDRSGAICDEYAEKYAQFHIIHQGGNWGLSAARNTGMGAAAGEFVLFLDSDDLWYPQMLSCIDEFVDKTPDMVLFPFEQFDENGKMPVTYPPILPQGESGMEYLQRGFDIGLMPPFSVCCCMFRRQFLEENHLRFYYGTWTDDVELSMHSYPAARSLMWTDQVSYRYRRRSGSNTADYSIKKWYDAQKVAALCFERFPNSATANYYCGLGIPIASLGSRAETKDVVEKYAQREDILALVSRFPYRFARSLFRMFGYYSGSKIFLLLHKVKHVVIRSKSRIFA